MSRRESNRFNALRLALVLGARPGGRAGRAGGTYLGARGLSMNVSQEVYARTALARVHKGTTHWLNTTAGDWSAPDALGHFVRLRASRCR